MHDYNTILGVIELRLSKVSVAADNVDLLKSGDIT